MNTRVDARVNTRVDARVNTRVDARVNTRVDARVNTRVVLRARRNEKEMKVKPATSFKLLTIFIHKKVRQDSKQKNVSKQYLSSLCHKVPLK